MQVINVGVGGRLCQCDGGAPLAGVLRADDKGNTGNVLVKEKDVEAEAVGILARSLLIKAYSLADLFASAAITKTEFVFTMDLNFVLIACVVFLLSYIFKYGQVLQKDADETL